MSKPSLTRGTHATLSTLAGWVNCFLSAWPWFGPAVLTIFPRSARLRSCTAMTGTTRARSGSCAPTPSTDEVVRSVAPAYSGAYYSPHNEAETHQRQTFLLGSVPNSGIGNPVGWRAHLRRSVLYHRGPPARIHSSAGFRAALGVLLLDGREHQPRRHHG
jgi:hypothetical protein